MIKQARANHASVDLESRKQQLDEARRAHTLYLEQRPNDVARALSRRISTGDAGLPFLIIDTVFAVTNTGTERGESADINGAIEAAKDQLWKNCRHLGGDAVLFADFRLEHGLIAFTNPFAVTWNIVANVVNSVSRSKMHGLDAQDRQATLTVFAQGTAEKLFPTGTALSPQVYEQFDQRWLDMRLPPGVEEPAAHAPAHEAQVVGRGKHGQHPASVPSVRVWCGNAL